MDVHLFTQLTTAFGLGLLVGLQREKAATEVAGIRTFPLITLFGTLSGLLVQYFHESWIIAAGFLAVAALVISGSIIKQRQSYDPGITTEVAALVMYALGAYISYGDLTLAILLGASVAVLLQLKAPLHRFVAQMGEKDVFAVMRFAAIALVILPILPNKTYGPYQVLNPYDIWRMVVLVVGVELLGYAAYKLLHKRAGILLAGIIGGAISSTATTVAYARSTKDMPQSANMASTAIILASTVAVLRVIFIFNVISAVFFKQLFPPLMALFLAMVCISAWCYWRRNGDSQEIPVPDNPSELGSALLFAALYAFVILIIAAAKAYLGTAGLYVVALISGLTDVDAITLSTTRLVDTNKLDPDVGWRVVMVAVLANLLFKMLAVGILGNRHLMIKTAKAFTLSMLAGVLILILWP